MKKLSPKQTLARLTAKLFPNGITPKSTGNVHRDVARQLVNRWSNLAIIADAMRGNSRFANSLHHADENETVTVKANYAESKLELKQRTGDLLSQMLHDGDEKLFAAIASEMRASKRSRQRKAGWIHEHDLKLEKLATKGRVNVYQAAKEIQKYEGGEFDTIKRDLFRRMKRLRLRASL